jgi:integrase
MSPHAYNRAIARACKAAGVETWCPYRLRHTAATLIEASADMETAKAILGHSSINITQVYVHRDNKTAAAWAALHG